MNKIPNINIKIASIITVLHQGKIIAEGNPNEIRNNEEVQIHDYASYGTFHGLYMA